MKVARTVFLFAVMIPAVVLSYPGGVPGITVKSTSNGCTCHGNASPSLNVLVGISGPAAVKPGQTASYTVTVTDAAGSKGGVDIAASGGTLAPVSSFLKLSSGELVHNKAVAVPSTYSFTFTAPAATGTVTLYATGKGSAFTAWNNAPNFSIIVSDAATAVKTDAGAPASFHLDQNFPNPFNPATKIRFSLPVEAYASVKIFDIEGRETATLVEGTLKPGTYSAEWNAGRFPSGVYLFRLNAGGYSETRKMLLQK